MPDASCYPLPDSVSLIEATQIETLHCCLGGMEKLGTVSGAAALVIGDGPVGMIFACLLRLEGAREVVVSGTQAFRLAKADAFGATETVNVRTTPEALAGRSFDIVIEAAGTPQTIAQSIELAAPRGYRLTFTR